MPDDLDHEVIDSPQALFRHLYEAHGLVEALDLDPATAPLQFWLRRHTELERAASRPAAGRPTGERLSGDLAAGRHLAAGSLAAAVTGAGSGPRFRPFADPLVEALAAALVGRGLDERWVRRGLSTYTGTDGRHGEEAVRTAFVAPMLEAVAAQLAGGPPSRAPWPPATPRTAPREAAGQDPTRRAPAPRQPPTRRAPAPRQPPARQPARPEPAPHDPTRRAPAPQEPAAQTPGTRQPPARQAARPEPAAQERAGRTPAAQEPAPRASMPRGPAPWEPAARAASSGRAEGQSGGRDTWAPQPLAARAAGPDLNADFMALADVLQERRRSRGGRHDTPTPRASTPPATRPATPPSATPGPARPPVTTPPVTTPPGPREAREPDDDVMALANALQRGRGSGRQ